MVIGALSAVTAPADPRNNRELKNKQIKSNIYAAVMAGLGRTYLQRSPICPAIVVPSDSDIIKATE